MDSESSNRIAEILIVTPDFAGPTRNGGIGTATYHQAVGFSRAGYGVTILFTGHNEVERPAYWVRTFRESFGWEYIDLVEWSNENAPDGARLPPFHGLLEMNWSYQTLLFMKTRHFDVVFFQDWLSCGLRPMQYKQAGLGFKKTRLILTLHSYHQWIWEGMQVLPGTVAEMVRQSMEDAAIRLPDALIAPSKYMADYTRENLKNLNQTIEVIPYCYSDYPDTKRITEKISYGPFDHLVFFGRLETRKGLRLFLDAVISSGAVAEKIRKITFLGRQGTFEGLPAREGIFKTLTEYGLLEWEVIDGLDFNEAMAWMKNQKNILVAAPSLMDNLPLGIIELYLNKIPFVATNVGGIPEIVGHKNSGMLVCPSAGALRDFFNKVIGSGEIEIDYSNGYNHEEALTQNLSFLKRQLDILAAEPKPKEILEIKSPAISVIVPHFESTVYLKNALESLWEQDIKEKIEIIVVDDCSRSKTEVAEFDRMAATWMDSRVRFIKSEVNRGPSGTRNFAASQASADYLVFFDCDNEAAPDMLSTMLKAAVNSELDFLTIFTYQIMQPDRAKPEKLDRSKVAAIYMPIGPALEVGAFNNIYGDACCIMKRDVFNAVGGFSSKFGSYEDWEIFANLCFNGYRMGVIPQPLMYYRNMEDGFSKTTSLYRNRMRILTRYATPSGISAINWLEVLKFATGSLNNMAVSRGRIEASVYSFFSKLDETEISTFLFPESSKNLRTPLNETLFAMRKALKPVIAQCLTANKRQRILIYGIGEHTLALLGTTPILAEYVAGFVDRRPRDIFLGLPCYRPEQVQEMDADIIVYSSREYELQMYDNLKHLEMRHVLLYNDFSD
jgi:GT2 family glycosyltransferase/glycosyltransferase involved in cell wall biosynthesis